MKNTFKNKIVLWILFGLFVTWFLIGLLDGAPESWTQNESRNVFLKSLGLLFFIIASLLILRVLTSKKIQENIIAGFYLFLFSFVVFLFQPYSSLSWFISELLSRILQPSLYTHPISSLFHFQFLLFFTLWVGGSLISFFSSFVWLGVLKYPSFTWQLPNKIKIGKFQIVFGIFLLFATFCTLIWIQEDGFSQLHLYEAVNDILDTLQEQNPTLFDEVEPLDMTNALVMADTSYSVYLFFYSLYFFYALFFILSFMLIFKGLININSK
jgi:hypothetical protein